MTLVLELSPEIENELRLAAVDRNVTVESVAVEALSQFVQRSGRPTPSDDTTRRLSALSSLGTYDTRQKAGFQPTTEADDARSSFYDDGLDAMGIDEAA